jgi:protein involved in ribonucleotide reduction
VNVVVDGHVVLDFAVITNGDPISNKYALPHGNVFSDSGTTADMHEVPNSGAVTYLGTVINNGAGMDCN